MINLLVDEAYAFDYLSVLEIKKDKFPNIPSQELSFKKCQDLISSQLGDITHEILSSKEYLSLKEANEIVFNAIDMVRLGFLTAREVDALNSKRFACKSLLQKKFFGKDPSEFKN